MKKVGLALVCLLLLAAPAAAVTAGPPGSGVPYTIMQITDDSVGFEWEPKLDAGQIAWIGVDPGSCDSSSGDWIPCDTEIYLWDGTTRRQLTQNFYSDVDPALHSGRVAWRANMPLPDGRVTSEVFFYDGSSVRQLTQNNQTTIIGTIQTHNGQVLWSQKLGEVPDAVVEYYFFDGAATQQITYGSYELRWALLNNGRIALTFNDGNDNEVGIWENGTVTRLTDNQTNDNTSVFDGQYILGSSVGYGVFLWDGTTFHLVTDSAIEQSDMSNGWVVWRALDPRGGQDYEIFLWDGTATRQITSNRFDDGNPFIHNGQVAWETWDGNDYEVFLATPK